MLRPAVALLLLVGLTVAGCSWFADKKQPLPGERISVLSLDRQLKPDPDLAKIAISLPKPVANPDWPEPGGYPNHAMQHLALSDKLSQVWKSSIGEGSSRYTQRLVAADHRQGAGLRDGWRRPGRRLRCRERESDLAGRSEAPENYAAIRFGGGVAFWNDRLYVSTGYAEVVALDPGERKVIWKTGVGSPVHSGADSCRRAHLCGDRRERARRARRRMTGGGCGRITAFPRRRGCSAAPARRSKERWSWWPIRRVSFMPLRVENGRPLWSDNLVASAAASMPSRPSPIFAAGRSSTAAGSSRSAIAGEWWRSICAAASAVWEQDIGQQLTALGSPAISSTCWRTTTKSFA